MKKISVITINFNNLAGLKKTFESVFFQTYNNFEFIVIDGGSTDGSLELIKEHQDKISYWVSEKDKGVYHAMNKGILVSCGEYLNFMNSGDYFYANTTLEEAEKSFDNKDLVYGNAKFVSDKGNMDFILSDNIDFYFFYHHSLCHQATFIKKKLFNSYGLYNENFKIVSDWEFAVKAICLYQCSIKFINLFVCIYDLNGISTNNNYQKIGEQEREVVYQNYFKYYVSLCKKAKILEDKRVKEFVEIKKNKPIRYKILKLFLNLFRTKIQKNTSAYQPTSL